MQYDGAKTHLCDAQFENHVFGSWAGSAKGREDFCQSLSRPSVITPASHRQLEQVNQLPGVVLRQQFGEVIQLEACLVGRHI